MTTFYKYHGLGNDFVVLETPEVDPSTEHVERWCDRHRGIGADGIVVLQTADDPEVAARMVVYNRDGSRPEMCGNGIRCAARHLVEQTSTCQGHSEICIGTDAGPRTCRVTSTCPWQIEVAMGSARVADAPVEVEVAGTAWSLWPVDMGNPHGVHVGMRSDEALEQLGQTLNEQRSEPFDDGVNVECVAPTEGRTARAAVYERGVGRTPACGTGACAVAAALWATDRRDPHTSLAVRLPGGELEITRRDGQIWMKGGVEAVFQGDILGASSFVFG